MKNFSSFLSVSHSLLAAVVLLLSLIFRPPPAPEPLLLVPGVPPAVEQPHGYKGQSRVHPQLFEQHLEALLVSNLADGQRVEQTHARHFNLLVPVVVAEVRVVQRGSISTYVNSLGVLAGVIRLQEAPAVGAVEAVLTPVRDDVADDVAVDHVL